MATAAVVCAALALGTAGVALAGQNSHSRDHSSFGSRDHGDHHGQGWNDADGVVTAFTTTSVTLLDEGVTTTYTLVPGTTTYFEGKTAGVVGDLLMGENVKLELTSTTPQTVTKVTICLVHVFGTVTGITGNVITLAGFHGSTFTVTVVPGTTTYTSDGAASAFTAIMVGSKISAVGLPGTTAGSVTANSVNIWVPPVKTHADGVVTAFTTTSVTLLDEGVTTTYTLVPGTTTYFEGKTAGVVGDLLMGENVKLELTSTTPQTVTKVTICLVHVFGTVTGITGNVITLAGFHGSTFTVSVVPGTTTYTSDGAASAFTAIMVGSKISAVGLPGTTAGSVTANSVNIFVNQGHGNDHGHSQGHHSHLFVSLS